MTKLNLVFQRDDINLFMVRPMVQSSIAAQSHLKDNPGPEESSFSQNCKGHVYRDIKMSHTDDRSIRSCDNVRANYIQELIDALIARFPENYIDILTCIDTHLNPEKYPNADSDLQQYANPAINVVIDHFGKEKETEDLSITAPVINAQDARKDTPNMMRTLRGYGGLNFQSACSVLVRDYNQIYPDWAKLAKIALVIPVPAQTGFSLQNRIKNASRRRLTEEKATRLMRIASANRDINNFDFERASRHFLCEKTRQKQPKAK
ncbi:UNVERIFIED_CONTAM: hypothetical protein FKN15_048532 [Acipenser sinensis]